MSVRQTHSVGNRYFRRRWDESRGDQYETWGAATYYFEVGENGWPTRQIEVYDAGPVLRYGLDHQQDAFGQLGEAQLDELEDWSSWVITKNLFDEVWSDRP